MHAWRESVDWGISYRVYISATAGSTTGSDFCFSVETAGCYCGSDVIDGFSSRISLTTVPQLVHSTLTALSSPPTYIILKNPLLLYQQQHDPLPTFLEACAGQGGIGNKSRKSPKDFAQLQYIKNRSSSVTLSARFRAMPTHQHMHTNARRGNDCCGEV